MSLFVYESSWLSIEPRVWVEDDKLRGRASFLLRMLSLFSYDRLLTVDRAARMVTVESRVFWFYRRSHTVKFDQIERIDYKFASLTTSWSYWVGRTDQLESFSVGLIIEGERDPLHIFSFRGEGAVNTGIAGIFFGDSLFDGQGTQESSSRRFVEELSRFTGASLSRTPPQLTDKAGRAWACSTCSHPGPPRRVKCLYCGGLVAPPSGGSRASDPSA
jgi:hypothetical protein